MTVPIAPYGSTDEMEYEMDRLVELHAHLPRDIRDFMVDAVAQCRALEAKLAPPVSPMQEIRSEARLVQDLMFQMPVIRAKGF